MKDELPLWQQQCPAQAAVHGQQQMGEVLFLSGRCSGLLGWHQGSIFPSEYSYDSGMVFALPTAADSEHPARSTNPAELQQEEKIKDEPNFLLLSLPH